MSPMFNGRFNDRWCTLWQMLGGTGDGRATYDKLQDAYSQPERAYHNLDHIHDCIDQLDAFKEWLMADDLFFIRRREPKEGELPFGEKTFGTVEMALWFHDAVYDAQAKDNEAQSARLAENELTAGGFPTDVIADIKRLIMATQHQSDISTRNPDEDELNRFRVELFMPNLISDIDLSILGRRPSVFAAYDQHIRQEYQIYPDEVYYPARATVLDSFLARDQIYQNFYFHKKYEATARQNLTSTIRAINRQYG